MSTHNLSGYDVNPNRSVKCWSTTFMVFVSLIILHLNNQYSERISSFKHNSSENEVFPILYNVTAYEVTSIFRFIYNILHVINVNMVVYLFLGLLLFKRIRLNKPTNSQLRNLNIPKIKETLLSDQVKQSPEFLKKLNDVPLQSRRRIYCLRKGLGHELSDTEILQLISHGRLKTRELESVVRNPFRAVELRRLDLSTFLNNPHIIERIPYKDYDYRLVYGQCCEEVIGYMPIPVGKIGPLLLDGRSHYIPLATTEGCLVASTNRGCRAIFLAGGIKSVVYRDQMTRAPVVWFPSIIDSVKCIAWIDSDEGFQILKSAFDKTSAHVNLLSVFACPAGRYIHIRFAARTGDAMGMNMVSKATDSALHCLQKYFSNMQVISLSGNMCTDKKPATINTILGRGKSVIAEAHLSADVLAQVLHTNAQRLARLTHSKNWIGSAMAGCPGMMGCNAHAANIIAGMFAATGQDLAQVVDSSSCLTQLEVDLSDDSLVASVTMPCLEVGTVGGGTRLPGQRACLDLLDLSVDRPTEHLSRIIAGTVLAAELSLMAALDTDDLVKAHMHFNRAKQSTNSNPCSHSTTADYNNNDNNSNIYDNHSIALSSKSTVTDNSDVRESVHSIHVKPLPVKSDLSVNSVIPHYTM
uniref:3-hydroxy-3-methylglutaryl-coenzyme A reductase n=1 Tax=Schistosoma haematobium TaxID=6185 RepID=A0A095A364_SCHHA